MKTGVHMRVLQFGNHCLLALVLLRVAPGSSAAPPDLKLIAMVPPGAQIVSGISSLPHGGQPDQFVLLTHDNVVDLQDFFALSGVDGARAIRQLVFVAIANNAGALSEHGLLMTGHFDQPLIYKSATQGGATVTAYRGIPILEIQPFAREKGTFSDVRWLAILDSNVLVFGTIATLRGELDRYSDRSPPDSSLVNRLARLRVNDQTWCLLSPSTRNDEIQGLLSTLDPELAEIAQSGGAFEFGIHVGRRVEFDYALDSTVGSGVPSKSLIPSPAPLEPKASLLPSLNIIASEASSRGVIKISMSRYRAWLAEVRGYAERCLLH
jgi:hypothetical protein